MHPLQHKIKILPLRVEYHPLLEELTNKLAGDLGLEVLLIWHGAATSEVLVQVSGQHVALLVDKLQDCFLDAKVSCEPAQCLLTARLRGRQGKGRDAAA